MNSIPTRIFTQFILGLMLVFCMAYSAAEEDILKPEEAFRYSAVAVGDVIEVRWDIEPEHYLYKERMSFKSLTDGVQLGTALMPKGKPYDDEFFGPMEIYRGQIVAKIPFTRGPVGAKLLKLEIRSQGCADIGLCYPPQRWTTQVDLADAQATPLNNLFGDQKKQAPVTEPLPPEEAFKATATRLDDFRLEISWSIEPGYYLYRHSMSVRALEGIAQTGPISLPPGENKWDEHFGDTQVFYDTVKVQVPLLRPTPRAGLLELELGYQGCKENSICYPPQIQTLAIDLPAASNTLPPPPPVNEQDRLSALILDGNMLWVMLSFAGLGLLLAFTPCVLPMVPILSGIIAGEGEDVTTTRAFALSLTYVLGMALTYTIAGATFAALGGQLQAILQKPWIIISVAGLFIALALSMFGLYEIQMPATIQTKLTQITGQQKGGRFVGTAIMGALSALVVTTCVAPPLVAALMVIAQSGDMLRGGLSLFAMSIGMGIPLLVIGTSAGKFLPKAGAWMDKVKGAFGFMMLGLAIWMLERILPPAVTLALWAALVFMAAVFLGAFQSLDGQAGTTTKLAKGFGLLAALYGAALLIGALSGAKNPLQPLRFIGGDQQVKQAGLSFKQVKSVEDFQRELAQASAAGKPAMLDFYADWCVSCKEMEHYTFTDERVQAALSNGVLLQADVTANDEIDQALLDYFDIFGPPTIIFFDDEGKEKNAYRLVGYMPAEKFAAHAGQAFAAKP